ncbi:hypothetical protein [Brevibacillus sp. NRS-1366]|uniref:hypothetical protein n=1 Tax=Brevibacillus sp. NRS-1366 TaxID=3233899 RepID=UPI003D243B92
MKVKVTVEIEIDEKDYATLTKAEIKEEVKSITLKDLDESTQSRIKTLVHNTLKTRHFKNYKNPQLKECAMYAQEVIDFNPEIAAKAKKAKQPLDILVPVHQTMIAIGAFDGGYTNDSKDYSLEVAKAIVMGYYKEVNEYYLHN